MVDFLIAGHIFPFAKGPNHPVSNLWIGDNQQIEICISQKSTNSTVFYHIYVMYFDLQLYLCAI